MNEERVGWKKNERRESGLEKNERRKSGLEEKWKVIGGKSLKEALYRPTKQLFRCMNTFTRIFRANRSRSIPLSIRNASPSNSLRIAAKSGSSPAGSTLSSWANVAAQRSEPPRRKLLPIRPDAAFLVQLHVFSKEERVNHVQDAVIVNVVRPGLGGEDVVAGGGFALAGGAEDAAGGEEGHVDAAAKVGDDEGREREEFRGGFDVQQVFETAEEDIVGLDVAVDEVDGVERFHGPEEVNGQLHCQNLEFKTREEKKNTICIIFRIEKKIKISKKNFLILKNFQIKNRKIFQKKFQ